MFNLHVLNFSNLKNFLHYNFYDLCFGLYKYRDYAKELGFNVVYHEDTDVSQIMEKIDGIFSVWGNGINIHKETFFNYKISSFIDDIHWWDKEGLLNRLNFFKKVDVVFMPYYRTFLKYDLYKEFHKKVKSLHWWFPEGAIHFTTDWCKRKDKILFSGAVSQHYLLRQVIDAAKDELTYILPHCGRDLNDLKHLYYGLKFLEYAATFKGMVATSASPTTADYDNTIVHPLDYTLKKVYESLGCGCLSFMEETEDFLELGLKSYEHYIPINIENFSDQFKLIFSNDAEKIALQGREFVYKNHVTKNRVFDLLNALKKEWL